MISYKKSLISVVLTVFIICILFLSGPASAVTVGVPTESISSTTPTEGNSITFKVQMDVHTNDVIDVANVSVNISNGADSYVCVKYLNDTVISCDSHIVLNCSLGATSSYTASAGRGYGYGYNGTSGYINITQSHGYQYVAAYGNDAFSTSLVSGSAELVCNGTWTTPSVTADTEYTIDSRIYVDDGYYFSDANAPTITVQNQAASRSAGGSSSSESETGITEDAGALTTENPVVEALNVGNTLSFSSDSETHKVRLLSAYITASRRSATFEVSSTPQQVTLNEGESKELDLNEDGKNDVLVTLLEVVSFTEIKFALKSIEPSVQEKKTVATEPVTETTKPAEKTNAPGATQPIESHSSSWWIWLIVVAILVIFVIVIIRRRR